MDEPKKANQWEVIYDGSCAFCRRSQKLLAKKTGALPVRFLDGCSLGLSPEEFQEIRIRTPEGTTLSGFQGLVRFFEATSRWRFLWRLCLLPPLSWLGAFGYRLVARYRHRLAGKASGENL